MNAATASEDAALGARIAVLMSGATITGLTRVFGGNARRAFAFTAALPDGRACDCIMLCQAGGSHVESDTADEFAVLHALNGSGVRAPEALALDAGGTVAGGPGIVLARIGGEANAVRFLKLDAGTGRALTLDLADATADLHRFDWQAGALARHPRWSVADPVAAQIEAWRARYIEHRAEPLPLMAWLFDWLRANAPRPVRTVMVHGDLRPGNFLYDGAAVTAILDWEMAHPGDPAEDIAWIYRAMWSPERFVPLAEFCERHAARAGFRVPPRSVAFYRIFTEVKFATISLAASHAFAAGKTANLRHADRAAKVPGCVAQALDWIGQWEREIVDAAA
ncbi:phosphotransferase family protein [Novosphingobium colocasiae]|uniref:Phosphotransferase n=1 Tax=Novosphingobium colocasiae TaxID=1256513 RepID=A0A918P8V0_9SPHN|nr:phosphotransferase family protein [Novosphingobium colocasiae]GGY90573.1 phosphotransferase [Novosphingobium colocasiae]